MNFNNKITNDNEINKTYDNSNSIGNADTTYTQFKSRFSRKNRGNRIKFLSADDVKKDDEVYNQIFGNVDEEDEDFKISDEEEEKDKDSFDSDFFNEEEESDEEDDLHDSEKEDLKQKAIKNKLKEKIEMLRRGKKNKKAKNVKIETERPRLVLKSNKNKNGLTHSQNNNHIIKIDIDDLNGQNDQNFNKYDERSEEISNIILEEISEEKQNIQNSNRKEDLNKENKVSLRERTKVVNYNDNDVKHSIKIFLEKEKNKNSKINKQNQIVTILPNFNIQIPKILIKNLADKTSKSKKYKYDTKSALFFSGENHLVFYKKILVDYFTDSKFISKYNSLVKDIDKQTKKRQNIKLKSKIRKEDNITIKLKEENTTSNSFLSSSSDSEIDSTVEKFKKSLEKKQNRKNIKNDVKDNANYWNVEHLISNEKNKESDSENESEENNGDDNNMLKKKRKKVALERYTEYMTKKTTINKKNKKTESKTKDNKENRKNINNKLKKNVNVRDTLNDEDDSEIFKMNETQMKKLGEEINSEDEIIKKERENVNTNANENENGNIGFQYQKYTSYHQQPCFTQKELLYESIFTEIFNNQSLEELRKLEENTKKELPSSVKKKFVDFCKFKNNAASKSGKF